MHDYDSMKIEFIEEFNKYGITEKDHEFQRIYNKYLENCRFFQNYTIGNLDTFKKVSCLMNAIIKKSIVKSPKENDKIALDIGLSLIQKPIKYEGKNYDEPFKLEEISLQILEEDTYFWDTYYQGILDSIKYDRQKFGEINLFTTAEILELTYNAALERKKIIHSKERVKRKK